MGIHNALYTFLVHEIQITLCPQKMIKKKV